MAQEPTPSTSADETSLDRLPDDLRERIASALPDDAVPTAGRCDIGADGRYVEQYLVADGDRLVSATRTDGRWDAEWIDLDELTDARVVEGLGMSILRLLREGQVRREFRYSLRHAREIAALHRVLERRIKGEETPASDQPRRDRRRGHHHEDKKVRCDRCGRVIPAWSEDCPACMSRRKVLFRLLDFVKPYRTRAIAGVVVALVITLASIVQPYLIKPMIDNGLGGRRGDAPDWPLFVVYVSVLSGLIILQALGRGVQARLMSGLGSRVARGVRDRTYAHLHKLSLSFFSKKQTGSLVTRVTTDSDRLWDFVAFTVVELSMALLLIVGVGVAMFLVHWQLALFALLPVPVMAALMIFFHRRLHRFFRRIMHRWGQMTSVVADALPGVRVIKAFSQEGREVGRFEEKNRQVYNEELSLINTWTTFGPLMQFCTQIGVLIVWLLGGWWVVRDFHNPPPDASEAMTVGSLMAFIGFLGMFHRPIHMIAHMDRMLNRAAASAQRIFEILDTEPGIYSRSGAVEASDLGGHIELRDVSFSYDGVRRVLKHIDLDIRPGEMIGLAGPSGGGKTTMVNLICRFYDPLAGEILIDGVDVRDYRLESLRQSIGVVLQEPFLFHGTVAENIAYGHPDASPEQIIAAAKAANAHNFIVGFPDGYDTMVGERGQSLSGGERQRVSIARAILNNPRILILDEATSSVDTETEKLIQEALDRLIENRTTIAIAHRLSTLRKADRLVILEEGQLVEQGTHEELTKNPDGLYAKLVRMQNEMQTTMAI